jgi:3-deoxy-D-manno-octulosonic-acid transferase
MLLLNGRMSERSFSRYQRIQGTMAALLSGFTAVGVIREQDGKRYRALGIPAERIQVCGNMKYALQAGDLELIRKKYRQLLALNRETVFLCGSTRSGEEKLLLPVYERLQKKQAAGLVWIIAPRHLRRLPEIQALLEQAGHRYDLFFRCADKERQHRRQHKIILLDCMGELADLYAVGDFIFCGGSLVNKGGHNIMEPVSRGRPVFFGPFMQDFQDAVELILTEGAGVQVGSAEELADCLAQHQPDSSAHQQACTAAARLARTQQGAVRQQAEMVMRVLQEKK